MKPGALVLLLGIGILAATREPGAAPARAPQLLARADSPAGSVLQPVAAGVDGHPAAGTDSNVNGVLEPGETVQIDPFWKNTLGTSQAFTGSASNLAGPPGPSYSFADGFADYGTVAAGATADCAGATGDCYLLTVSGARPVPHWDVTFTETLSILGVSTTWTIHVGESFTDVPTTHPFYAYVEQLFHLQVTGGCGAGLYCPDASVTRAQMAVFLLKSEHGSGYVPPPCAGIFGDVPCPGPFTDWIEQLANEGITGGCGGGNYCPNNPVTRAQMAVFLLKTEHGSSYVPPTCAGIFPDVPCPSQFANWIEQLFHEGITGGCGGGDYCPNAAVTRGQMAVFLLRTFAPLSPPVPTPTAPPSTPTATNTAVLTATPTLTGSMPPTSTRTPTVTPSVTLTRTNTPTLTGSATRTSTRTPTNTRTPTSTRTPTNTATPNTNHVVQVGPNGSTSFVDSVTGTSQSNIAVGTTIEWDWVQGLHSSTSGTCSASNCIPGIVGPPPGELWDSGQKSSGSFTHQFNNVGTYTYFCTVHGVMMQGLVNVLPLTPTPGRPARR